MATDIAQIAPLRTGLRTDSRDETRPGSESIAPETSAEAQPSQGLSRRGFLARAALGTAAVLTGGGLLIHDRVTDQALKPLPTRFRQQVTNLNKEDSSPVEYVSDPELNTTLREHLVEFVAGSFQGKFVAPGAQNQFGDGLCAARLRGLLSNTSGITAPDDMRQELEGLAEETLKSDQGRDQLDRLFEWIGSFEQDAEGRVSVDEIAAAQRVDGSLGDSLSPQLERFLAKHWDELQQLSVLVAGVVLLKGRIDLSDV